MKNQYEIENFKSVAEFPKIITAGYAKEAMEIIDRKTKALKIETLKGTGMYLDALNKEIAKFEGFKKFIGSKIQELNDKEFERLTGKKIQGGKPQEPQEAQKTQEDKPKKTRKPRKTNKDSKKKSIIDEVKDIFSENTGEIE